MELQNTSSDEKLPDINILQKWCDFFQSPQKKGTHSCSSRDSPIFERIGSGFVKTLVFDHVSKLIFRS